MIETILIARDRKTGKDVLLAGREVPFRKQLDAYKDLSGAQNETYSTVALAQVQPHKKPLRFITKAEADERKKAHDESIKQAEKEAAKTVKSAKSKPLKGGSEKESATDEKEAAKTETKTGAETGSKSDAQ